MSTPARVVVVVSSVVAVEWVPELDVEFPPVDVATEEAEVGPPVEELVESWPRAK